MKQFFTSIFIAVLGAAIPLFVYAQSAQADDSADLMIQTARRAADLIDTGRAGEVWDAASPLMRSRVKRDEFVANVGRARANFKGIAQRTWAGVTRVRYEADGDVPKGLYGNIDFSTRLASGSTVFELITLRRETDGRWLVTGYVPRATQ